MKSALSTASTLKHLSGSPKLLSRAFSSKPLLFQKQKSASAGQPVSDGADTDADQPVRPFEALPSFPQGLPFLGNFHHLFKKPHGLAKQMENLKILRRECDPGDVGMLRAQSNLLNPKGQGRALFVFRPEFVEKTYRNEGVHPCRGPGMEIFRKWREERPDFFPPGESLGVLIEEGEKWKEFRSQVQQDMMRPSSAYFYVDAQQEVAESFVRFIRKERESAWNSQGGVTPDDFLSHLYSYAFEAVATIALDTRLGSFSDDPDPRLREILRVQKENMQMVADVMLSPLEVKLLGKYSPKMRKMEAGFDVFSYYLKEKIDAATERIKENMEKSLDEDSGEEKSVLEKLIRRCGTDSTVPFVLAFDMCAAGIDTTGNTLGFLLYLLAVNPEAQARLRSEILEHDPKLTAKSLNKMKYLRAVMKESMRLFPLFSPIRETAEDMVLDGYHIPAKTLVFMPQEIRSQDDRIFHDAESFLPERWLRENANSASSASSAGSAIHPFASLPFSFGPRACLGRRFAELELQVAICVLLRHFGLDWAGPTSEPLGYSWRLVNGPDQPLKFRFKDI